MKTTTKITAITTTILWKTENRTNTCKIGRKTTKKKIV